MLFGGFRFPVYEIEDIAQEIKNNGFANVEITSESEAEQLCLDLEEYGFFYDDSLPFDHDALDLDEDPDFYARAFLNDDYYIDFFLISGETDDSVRNSDEIYL